MANAPNTHYTSIPAESTSNWFIVNTATEQEGVAHSSSFRLTVDAQGVPNKPDGTNTQISIINQYFALQNPA